VNKFVDASHLQNLFYHARSARDAQLATFSGDVPLTHDQNPHAGAIKHGDPGAAGLKAQETGSRNCSLVLIRASASLPSEDS